jgi:hypothetical protein
LNQAEKGLRKQTRQSMSKSKTGRPDDFEKKLAKMFGPLMQF